MRTNYLLPNYFKKIGWFLLIPGLILGVFYLIEQPEPEWLKLNVFAFFDDEIMGQKSCFTMVKNNIIDEIIGLLLIIGAGFVAFSKEKVEDEFITQVRLEALVWATYLNYAILAISLLFVFGIPFFWVLVFNMFTILLFFIIKFNWTIYQSTKALNYEE